MFHKLFLELLTQLEQRANDDLSGRKCHGVSCRYFTLADNVLASRSPTLAWPQDNEDCVLRKCLEIFSILHLSAITLQHYSHWFSNIHTQLLSTWAPLMTRLKQSGDRRTSPFRRNSSYVPTTRAFLTLRWAFQTLTGLLPPCEWLDLRSWNRETVIRRIKPRSERFL